MGDRFKFRAWVNKSRMINNEELIKKYNILAILDDEIDENLIPMQFTRLHDKNGIEIYEGDILRLDEDSEILVVKYIAPSFWLVDTNGDRLFNAFPYFKERNIIGNIYQNKDLLK